MTGPAPEVSVVVPTHDRPGMLARCLDALTRLRFDGAIEVIIVDDGGARPAAPVVADFAGLLPVTDVRQARSGPAAARNAGLRRARGRLVALTDDDCAPYPGWLTALVAAHDGSGALVGGRGLNVLDRSVLSETSERLAEAAEAKTGFHTSNNLLADRDHLVALGGFDERFVGPAGEDRVLAMRWVQSGGHLITAPDAVVGHAHGHDGLTFLAQHQRFGRAAVRVAEVAGSLGLGEPTMSRRDQLATVVEPWRRGDARVGAVTLASQAAVGLGALRETLGRGPGRKARASSDASTPPPR